MNFKSIRDFDLKGKIVLLRADLNVPKQDGKVTDKTRIDRLKPTIDLLCAAGARTLILSHFGRPDGTNNAEMSLEFLAPVLSKSWGVPVGFAKDCIGAPAEAARDGLQDGGVVLLENLRFRKDEEKNDPTFAAQLAALGDLYVNDAFSASHRAHASIEGITHHVPAAAGLLMEAELSALDQALGNPAPPVAALVGGSKISTKLEVLYHLSEKVDYLILGGGMANTFLFADGAELGSSLCEKDMADEARKISAHAKDNGCQIVLPVDCITVTELKPGAQAQTDPARNVPEGRMAIDIGPDSAARIAEIIGQCKTVVWNGPMGVFEVKPFDAGTNAVAECVAKATKAGTLVSIAGGGDTVAALENAGTVEDFTYISTAGGAFLEWLEGKTLPGVAALQR